MSITDKSDQSHNPTEAISDQKFQSLADFANSIMAQLDDQIRLADLKAGFVIAASSAMLGALGLFRGGIARELLEAGDNGKLAAYALVVLIGLLLASITTSVLTVLPRMYRGTKGGLNPFFFGDIADTTTDNDYVSLVSNLSVESLTAAKLRSAHAKARIARKKFLHVKTSLWLLLISLFFWGFTQTALSFAHRSHAPSPLTRGGPASTNHLHNSSAP